MATALIIGCSDGIGLAVVRALLAAPSLAGDDWRVTGVSRSPSPVEHARYIHHVADVRGDGYDELLEELVAAGVPDACIYCAGIGELLDPEQLADSLALDPGVFEVNLVGVARTAAAVLPAMTAAGRGHFVGISSLADAVIDDGAPSYAASKAGMSSYLYGLGLALRSRGVRVTAVRLGFVDTKLARAELRPFMMSPERAAAVVLRALRSRPLRITRPLRMAFVLWLVGWGARLRLWLR